MCLVLLPIEQGLNGLLALSSRSQFSLHLSVGLQLGLKSFLVFFLARLAGHQIGKLAAQAFHLVHHVVARVFVCLSHFVFVKLLADHESRVLLLALFEQLSSRGDQRLVL